MELKEKKPVTLYLDTYIRELLDTYCYLAKRNKTRVMNEAIKDYLEGRLKSEMKESGMAQWKAIWKLEKKEIGKNLIQHLKTGLIT